MWVARSVVFESSVKATMETLVRSSFTPKSCKRLMALSAAE
jgi:hypothetical protein